MSKLINSINHLLALMRLFPDSENFGLWKRKVEELLAELRNLIRAKNEENTPIPFVNAVTQTDVGFFLFTAFIFSLGVDEIDETDPPSQPKLDLIDELVAELKKENISEIEKRVLDDWRSTYKTRVDDWNYQNGYAP